MPVSRRSRRTTKSSLPAVFAILVVLTAGVGIAYLALNRPPPEASPPSTTTIVGEDEPAPEENVESADPVVDNAKMLFDDAVVHAQMRGTEYREIIEKFEKAREEGKGTVYAMKADEKIKEWQEKWDEIALSHFKRHKSTADKYLDGGAKDRAARVWEKFPERLLSPTVKAKIAEETARFGGTTDRLLDDLGLDEDPKSEGTPED